MEKLILKQFLYENKLKFSEIGKSLNIKSNLLSYHLNRMVKKDILTKSGDIYELSESSEYLIPYLNQKQAALPVILIKIQDTNNQNEVFLINRIKRPFYHKFGLPGGRILIGETIEQATQRIMKDKYKINCKLNKINSISIEHVRKKEKVIHSFLLITVNATTKDKIDLTNIEKNRTKIIPSDYKLIKTSTNSKIEIPVINSKA